MKAKEILTDAMAIIENGWTQGSYAKKSDGFSTVVSSRKASCFCSLGAIRRAVFNKYEDEPGDVGDFMVLTTKFDYREFQKAVICLGKAITNKPVMDIDAAMTNVIRYNDAIGRSKEQVKTKFIEAIEQCE